uniref:Cytochrome c oxidase subunit 2 n=2 Tax=Aplysia TaxID=6499 RepID=A0A075DSU3_APLKU|nr:cytochrome c oxidase subunit II [Aplysia dactylomela]ABK92210.1 cytochrome c oxidase subunit II [Aplysia dactylomela]AHX02663.1 cytochrome c oxidase subunit II [Aplysia kurodai]
MSTWGQLNLIDAASPLQSEMFLFHDHAIVLLLGIFSFVAILGVKLTFNKFTSRTMLEAQSLETIWTIIPALLLLWLALPSLRLLYLLDEQSNSGIVLKSTGHQWYWSYEIPFTQSLSFDSYMVPESDLNHGDFRLLEVDNRATVPFQMETSVITTSADVLHAWTLPSMGVKMDAVPGRLNSMSMFVEKPGVYYGQCSEICGANHSFMPIVVEAVSLKDFVNYLEGAE